MDTHIVDTDQKIFPVRRRTLRCKNLDGFIASFTGLEKYASPVLRSDAIMDIVGYLVEIYGDDRDGWTYAHQYIAGPRIRRFTIYRFPLEAQPDRLSVRTTKKEAVEDTGWFGVEPENEIMWMRVLETFLVEIAKKLLSSKEIHLRLGGPVKEKTVEGESAAN